jgi:PqqD family protein of HPr-rel-A system
MSYSAGDACMQASRFRFVDGLTLRWRYLGLEVVVYEEESAVTHIFDKLSAALLLRIYRAPASRSELTAAFKEVDIESSDAEIDEFIDKSVASFTRLGLVNSCK